MNLRASKIKIVYLILFAALAAVLLSSCAADEKTDADLGAKYAELHADENGMITILTQDVLSRAGFFNYDADGIMIQLVALRDKNEGVHIAFNTCQSCSPSPKAYYQQSGDVLKCMNCGFTFEPEEVGITQGGCNPWPVDGVVIGETEITVPVSSLEAMRALFASWGGPTE